MYKEIEWYSKLDLAAIERVLSAEHVAWIKRQPYPAITASSRAHGAWVANEREEHAAYSSLADLLSK